MSSHRDSQTAAALTIALLAACHGPDTTPSKRDSAGSGSAQAAAPVAALPHVKHVTQTMVTLDEPRIDLPKQESFQLIGAGTGTKAKLRYAFAAGTAALTAETQLSSRHLTGGAFTPPIALPALRDGFAITTTADRHGALAVRPLVAEAAAASADADAYLAPWRSLLQNRRVTLAIDDRGGFAAPVFNDDPTGVRSARSKDELVARLLSLIVPVPVEPIAPGASWRVVTILRQGPVYAKQTATYTLLAASATRWKLHAKLLRVAEEQRIIDPGLPPGTTAELLALFRVLEGDIEVDPAHPMISGGQLTIESRMHVKLQAAGQATGETTEQLFEDTGDVRFSLCRAATAPAGSAAPGTLGDCPDGFSR